MEKSYPPFKITKEEADEIMNRQTHLAKQTFEQVPHLDPNAHFVISRQATVNIGTIGHVAHGKTTVVKAISGVHTVKFQKEKVRNITIFLGYANAKIFKCPKCPAPKAYVSYPSHQSDDTKCNFCGERLVLVRHVSFVDCPGHDVLMATMLTGAAVMDAALLLIAGNMSCPQPQTSEHLAAVDIMKLNHIIILQNKVDLIFKDERAAVKNYEEIKAFVQGTRAENSPIIPISAQLKYNVDAVCQYICEYIPTPIRDFVSDPELIVIRSFDINRPGEETDDLKGGVAGGSILKGVLRVGDEIEIRPGNIVKDSEGKIECNVLRSKIVSLLAEKNDLLYAVPGGLIGCGLLLDPALTKSNRLVGNVLGYPDKLPDIYVGLEINYHLLRRLVGVKSETGSRSDKVRKASKGEILMINVGSNSTGGRVESVSEKTIKLSLIGVPICARIDEKVSISRKIDNKWRLIGWGTLKKGTKVTPKTK